MDIAATYRDVFDHLTRTDRNLFQAAIVVVAVAPAIIGVFWGAPLVARELEAGTHRLAWTQSVTRTRWLATKLGVTTLAAAATVGLLTFAVTWWSQPLDGALSSTQGGLPSRITPVTFAMRGVVPVGYAVFAVVLGATLGAVFRRSLPAMAVTLGWSSSCRSRSRPGSARTWHRRPSRRWRSTGSASTGSRSATPARARRSG